jgi:serine/threonine protein kinase/tetratricopeptide (TPR) repeat protein
MSTDSSRSDLDRADRSMPADRTDGPGPTGAGAGPRPELERLGDYRILREIGRGGMGVVYEAERESLKARVALKVMHPTSRADAARLRRFEREARSAARLHHTNIVPVFDYGEHGGVCYYAMQLIDGVGLNEVIEGARRLRSSVAVVPVSARAETRSDDPAAPAGPVSMSVSIAAESLLTGRFATGPSRDSATDVTVTMPIDRSESDAESPPEAAAPGTGPRSGVVGPATSGGSLPGRSDTAHHREVARIGVQVADGLDYAHRQGVIHRDIKPSNLLLDAQGTVWVADFGLAKLVEGEDLSQSHELAGTLRFMAPERLEGITDRRGDIYALGATLYELLTLKPAFAERDPARLLRRIMDLPIVPPSQHDRRISRDLETIILKALARDARDRFADAGEMRDELRRFLEGRPLRSRPVGVAERAWRWCKRNPILAGLVAAVAGLTVALAVGSTAAWLRLRTAYAEVEVERNRAEQNFRDARRAVDDSFTRISENALLHAPGMQPLRRQLLEDALKYYQGFARRLADRPEARADLAAAFARVSTIVAEIGSNEEALDDLRRARDLYQSLSAAQPTDRGLRRDLARSIAGIAALHNEAGRREEAEAEYRRALDIQRSLAAAEPGDHQLQEDLAAGESGLGGVLARLGRDDEAAGCHARALAIHERLAAAVPDSPRYQSALASDYAGAARRLSVARRDEEAIPLFGRSIAMLEALVASHPEVASYRSNLAASYNTLGLAQRHLERLDGALASYQKSREAQEALAAANPSVTDYRYDLAGTFNNIANTQAAQGRRDEAIQTHRRALEINEGLVAADPRVARYLVSMAASYNAIGMLQAELGRLEESLRTLERFRDRMRALLADDPENRDARNWLSNAVHNAGNVLAALGRHDEAVSAYRQAIEETSRVIAASPLLKNPRRSARSSYHDLTASLAALGRPDEAAAALREQPGLWDDGPEALCELARALALVIPAAAPERRASYADQAMDALRRAVAAGYRDASRLIRDRDLRPLRDRGDFRLLAGDLGFPGDPLARPD